MKIILHGSFDIPYLMLHSKPTLVELLLSGSDTLPVPINVQLFTIVRNYISTTGRFAS